MEDLMMSLCKMVTLTFEFVYQRLQVKIIKTENTLTGYVFTFERSLMANLIY